MQPLISVIVPVYNAEEFIRKCLDSIINQTYRNLEVILVDDGSPDKSGKICDDYSLEDSRIKVIHQQNQGLSLARNNGMSMATGDFFAFVDSDDYIDADMFKILLDSCIENECEMSFCSIYKVRSGEKKVESYFNADCILSNDELMRYAFLDKIPSYACNKLIKAECFNNIQFQPGLKYEDIELFPRLCYKIKKCAYVNRPLYYYVFNEKSITCNRSNAYINSYYVSNAFLKRLLFARENVPQYEDICIYAFIKQALYFYAMSLEKTYDLKGDYADEIAEGLDAISMSRVLSNSMIPAEKKLAFFCYRYCKPLFSIGKRVRLLTSKIGG